MERGVAGEALADITDRLQTWNLMLLAEGEGVEPERGERLAAALEWGARRPDPRLRAPTARELSYGTHSLESPGMRYGKFEQFRGFGLDELWLKAADARFASSLEPGHGHGEIALALASNGEVDRALRWLGSVLVDEVWDGFTPGASGGIAGEDVVNSPVHGAYVELALVHGRREKAVEDMQAWLKERPLRRDLWMVLARFARSDGESMHVLGGLGAWLERHPEDLGARLTKADLLQARGDLEVALLELRSLVQRLDGGSELPDGVLGFDPGVDPGSFGLKLPNSVPQDLFDDSEHEYLAPGSDLGPRISALAWVVEGVPPKATEEFSVEDRLERVVHLLSIGGDASSIRCSRTYSDVERERVVGRAALVRELDP